MLTVRKALFYISLSIVSFSGLFLTSCRYNTETARTYYVSPSGSDDNEGTITSPFRTLERINRMILNPGDTVLLEGGETFSGTFFLDSIDSGDETGRIVVGSYGNGKAAIDGGNKEGMVINNAEYFRICDLIVKGKGRKSGNRADGIFIITSDSFELDNIEVFGFQHSGILVMGSRDARLTHIMAHDNGFAGIHITGTHANDPVIYDNENLYIGYSRAYNNPGDPTILNNHSGNGILAASVKGGKIEYCEAYNNGWDMPWTGNGPVGIWIWDCTNFVIQYCLSHDNMTNPVAADGGGFDLDGGVSNSLIQYCISWSNQGAGIGLFEFGASKVWENNVIRYNISRNDGILNGGSVSVWKGENGGTMRNCAIYNNTFYNDTSKGISVSISTTVAGFSFKNNIFAYKGSFTGPGQEFYPESFKGNCLWNLSGYGFRKEDHENIFTNPMLMNPAVPIATGIGLFEENALSFFRPREESVINGRGIDPGSPFGYENDYLGIDGSPIKHGSVFEIGAVGAVNK